MKEKLVMLNKCFKIHPHKIAVSCFVREIPQAKTLF